MMTPADRHNALAREFVELAGRETANFADLMIVVESALVAAMLLNTRLHKLAPHVSVGLAEGALHRATERFAEQILGARCPSALWRSRPAPSKSP